MKLSFSVVVFSVFGAVLLSSSTAVVEGNMSMRGNSKSANELMKVARRVEDYNGNGDGYSYGYNVYGGNQYYNGQYGGQQGDGDGEGDGEEEEYSFLMNYSIKLLSCVSGEMVRNYENDGDYETSAVIFRLCPSNTCSLSNEYGCDEGYGDYVIGINTFLELYQRYQEEQQQDQEEDQNNNNNNNMNYNNGQYNGQQYNGQYNGYNNGQYNSLVVYNQYGAEFDASEYLECSEYKNDEASQDEEGGNQQNNNNYYSKYNYNYNANQYNNNNQQQQGQNGEDMQYFIGPGCSADGTTIGLKLYMNEECTYPANSATFSRISYGQWPNGIPFADGGLVSMNCANCYSQNENYEWELNEMCQDAYEQTTSRCEQGMTTNNYGMNYNYNNGQGQEQGQGQQDGDQYANYYQQQQQDQMQGGYYNSNNNGCDYINSLLSRKSLFRTNTGSMDEALVTAVIVLVSVAVIVGAVLLYTKFGPCFKNNLGQKTTNKSVDAGSVSTRSSDDELLTDAERTQIS